jgi:hypothetical protein
LWENFKKGGRVDNNQRLFLSARTAAVGAGCGRTDWPRKPLPDFIQAGAVERMAQLAQHV